MESHVPKTAGRLMMTVYRRILPAVNQELSYWLTRAKEIPNEELRTQAIASINSKRFHCQGGSVFALLAGKRWQEAIRFIVAYQTISDYLDNLCDRSTSMDPADFRLLHQSMADALSPGNHVKNYYALRSDQEDGNYLNDLVRTCQQIMNKLKGYIFIKDYLLKLEGLYGDLQVHKHVVIAERIPRLTNWFDTKRKNRSSLSWYEFSAATGSTLGVFCLVSYALNGKMTEKLAEAIYESYFPYMQGLHILLDYYIDQQEDKEEEDLNFCSYYPDQVTMINRLTMFIEGAAEHTQQLPDPRFHAMVHHGLVGLYLADPKVCNLASGKVVTKQLLQASGWRARFFHWNVKMYYRLNS